MTNGNSSIKDNHETWGRLCFASEELPKCFLFSSCRWFSNLETSSVAIWGNEQSPCWSPVEPRKLTSSLFVGRGFRHRLERSRRSNRSSALSPAGNSEVHPHRPSYDLTVEILNGCHQVDFIVFSPHLSALYNRSSPPMSRPNPPTKLTNRRTTNTQ